MVLGAVGMFVAGFVAWYTMWHRRMATAFERVPVGAAGARRSSCAETGQPGQHPLEAGAQAWRPAGVAIFGVCAASGPGGPVSYGAFNPHPYPG